ncbi:MAG: hypothetical protein CR981_02430 [Proteobacteria bacterium]|nr:MAG: hypothetical protein CR981_02430 [Pseudomonadota bacterium]PIE64628.1 MAG: hypothetical protein CSA26_07010 [Desulfobacterales bacterium]
MGRLQIKREVVQILKREELVDVHHGLDAYRPKDLVSPLFSSLCHIDELIRWHAISALGRVVATIADTSLEESRVIMRRFLWMLNDESGGIGWGVPEAMAEVMLQQDRLAREYLHMLVSYTLDDGPEIHQDGNFLELPLLQQGVLWGLCRMAAQYRESLLEKKIEDNLKPYFLSDDHQVTALVCCLADLLNLACYRVDAQRLQVAGRTVRIYVDGVFYEQESSVIVADYIDGIDRGNNVFRTVAKRVT